jgi:hypothetical protein
MMLGDSDLAILEQAILGCCLTSLEEFEKRGAGKGCSRNQYLTQHFSSRSLKHLTEVKFLPLITLDICPLCAKPTTLYLILEKFMPRRERLHDRANGQRYIVCTIPPKDD